MVIVNDNEVKLLNMQRHALLRELDRREIEQEEFNIKMTSILEKLKEKTNAFLEKNEAKNKQEEIPQEEDKVVLEVKKQMVEEKEKDAGRKPVKDSKASLIAKALMMKTVKTWDEVVEKVLEWKPDIDKAKTIKLGKNIVREVKNGKQPRWKKYTWDEEQFQLTEK